MAVVIVPWRTRRPPKWPMRLRDGHPLALGLLAYVPLVQSAYYRNLVDGQGPVAATVPSGGTYLRARSAGRLSGHRAGTKFTAASSEYLRYALPATIATPVTIATGMVGGHPGNSSVLCQLAADSGTDQGGPAIYMSTGGVVRATIVTSAGTFSGHVAGDTIATNESVRVTALFPDLTNRFMVCEGHPKTTAASAKTFGGANRFFVNARYNGASGITSIGNGAYEFCALWAHILPDGAVAEIHDNPWQLLERDAHRIYSIPVAGGAALAGDAIAQAQAAAVLAIEKALQASSAVGAIASAEIALGKPLQGEATSGASSTAELQHGVPLAADAFGSAAGQGSLALVLSLAGAAAGGAGASGALLQHQALAGSAEAGAAASATLAKSVLVGGASLASADAQGALTKSATLAVAAIAGAQANGSLLLAVTLAGDAIARASAQGALSVSSANSLAGDAMAGADASAVLQLMVHLAGVAVGGASTTASLSIAIQLGGAAIADAQALGDLTVVLELRGDALAAAQASGVMQLEVSLGGQAVAGATAQAAFAFADTAGARVELGSMRTRRIDFELRTRSVLLSMH